MFDIGLSELVLLGIVALVVLGPERLPEVAVTVGRWLGRLQRLWTLTKTQMEQEFRLDQIKNSPEMKVLPEIKSILENGTISLSRPVSSLSNPLPQVRREQEHGTNPR